MQEIVEALVSRLVRFQQAAAASASSWQEEWPDAQLQAVADYYGRYMARTSLGLTEVVGHYARLREDLAKGAYAGPENNERHAVLDRALAATVTAFCAERERAQRALLAQITHRMRGRLNVIGLAADMWLGSEANDTSNNADVVMKQLESFESLLEALSRPLVPMQILRAPLDLAVLCREAAAQPGQQVPALVLKPDSVPTVIVRGDAFRLREAIHDLIVEAARRGAGLVALRMQMEADRVTVRISDGRSRMVPVERDPRAALAWLLASQTVEAHGGVLEDASTEMSLSLPTDTPVAPAGLDAPYRAAPAKL